MVSHRSGETEVTYPPPPPALLLLLLPQLTTLPQETSIADFAVGLGSGQVRMEGHVALAGAAASALNEGMRRKGYERR